MGWFFALAKKGGTAGKYLSSLLEISKGRREVFYFVSPLG
ncbi:hypothetical protein DCCM_3543 [Desulfocucumis palustris]|uniref:Uncharacterized protein n=1 Tax=Desulfocucumis palustris TaxID=1898651 RepID=A0A2L2XDX4_9FIRM|nr:hypothetical protein DCCM_3543 [Desulfocucumis palustris]